LNPLLKAADSVKSFFAPRPSAPSGLKQAVNVTRGTVLAAKLELAGTGGTRRKGLLGRDSLLPGEGLWIAPCESVHTFFMRFSIDLVYLDRKHKVKKIRSSVGPWRLSACFSAHSVLELPAGTISRSKTERDDTVEISPAEAATCDQYAGDDSQNKSSN
jgi:uncharacterized protein